MSLLLKKPLFWVLLSTVLVAVGVWHISRPKGPDYRTAVAERGNLVQKVGVTGRVKAAQSVNLAFDKGGRVAGVYAKAGDKVFTGSILVELENADLAAQLRIEEAKLAELEAGARQEDIDVQRAKEARASTATEEARTNLSDKIGDAFTKADDAVRNEVDQFMINTTTQKPELRFIVSDYQLKSAIELGRVEVEEILNNWGALEAGESLGKIKSFLDQAAIAVNGLKPAADLSQTIIDGYKADVSTARTNVNTAISNLSAAKEKLRLAEADLKLAREELARLLTGARPEELEAQRAAVDNLRAQLAKTVIRAPFSGVVTKQDAKIGEIAAANSPLISLISKSEFEIEANIPEADIAKVAVGNEAEVTLDAYGDRVLFKAAVSFIDPAETIIEGVTTYRTVLQFMEAGAQLRSSMTANTDIITQRRENVVYVPQRAVITKNGGKFVRVLTNNEIREVAVKTGLAAEGNIEILEGVGEGDEVITFIPEDSLQNSGGAGLGGHF